MGERIQITVSSNTKKLIDRTVSDIKSELGEGAVVRTGYALGVILQRYYKMVDAEKEKGKEE